MREIDLASDAYFMREALRLAIRAAEAGEVPVGAVIVRDAKILARAHNQVETLRDATAHAEILALTQTAAALGDWRLEDTTLWMAEWMYDCGSSHRVLWNGSSDDSRVTGTQKRHEKIRPWCLRSAGRLKAKS